MRKDPSCAVNTQLSKKRRFLLDRLVQISTLKSRLSAGSTAKDVHDFGKSLDYKNPRANENTATPVTM
jgi:hypothetical protein